MAGPTHISSGAPDRFTGQGFPWNCPGAVPQPGQASTVSWVFAKASNAQGLLLDGGQEIPLAQWWFCARIVPLVMPVEVCKALPETVVGVVAGFFFEPFREP